MADDKKGSAQGGVPAAQTPSSAAAPATPAASTGDIRTTFERIYEKNEWGSSGPGSDPFVNIGYRGFLETFMRMNDVRSVVDVGCGDWQYSRFLNLDHINYRGFDVVSNLIETNTRNYARKGVSFALMPEDKSKLPAADLLIMKDVLQHLPDALIHEYHTEVFPRFRWVLLTNSWKKLNTPRNIEAPVGGFRCLDVAAPPYRFKGAYVFEAWAEWERIRTFLIYK
ncbi:hypothetical protein ACQW02_24015 [Humitalea sp. 24SJ18S-53]|uniref:hypothetical protein n=1 Tax=Humitalea sp. 24SJ18S-53 TaxID=3422307 RepID=UPI003D6683A0